MQNLKINNFHLYISFDKSFSNTIIFVFDKTIFQGLWLLFKISKYVSCIANFCSLQLNLT